MDYIEVRYEIKVRRHKVDTERLKELLRTSKEQMGLTNKQIAHALCVPLTNVEHWFRSDEYFSIPEPHVWGSIKKLLHIETDEFDRQITELVVRPGVFEKAGRMYPQSGIAPTITAAEIPKVIIWK